MRRRPWSAGTRLFSSADDDSSDDSSSDASSGLWARRASPGSRHGVALNSDGSAGALALGTQALPALATALREAKARSSAALAKASRLQEENRRLRDALQAASKKAERGDRAQEVLSKSELRVRELESDNRQLRQDLESSKVRMRQIQAKTRQSLSTLRGALKDLEGGEKARCRKWRSTTRSLRALLESLRRHVQRGHHSAPTFTAFQLIEQLFKCLETQEADARLTPRRSGSPRGSPHSSSRISPPRAPDRMADKGGGTAEFRPASATSGAASRRRDSSDRRSSTPDDTGAGDGRSTPPARGSNPTKGGNSGERHHRPPEKDNKKTRRVLLREAVADVLADRAQHGKADGARQRDATAGYTNNRPSATVPSAEGSSQEDFSQHGVDGGERQCLNTEWAYRLAITKLTAQLKAAKERLRGEKEACRSASERADQEELRCRQLELEVEGLNTNAQAADNHRRGLEAMLEGLRRETETLAQEQRQESTPAATHALNAALGIVQTQQRHQQQQQQQRHEQQRRKAAEYHPPPTAVRQTMTPSVPTAETPLTRTATPERAKAEAAMHPTSRYREVLDGLDSPFLSDYPGRRAAGGVIPGDEGAGARTEGFISREGRAPISYSYTTSTAAPAATAAATSSSRARPPTSAPPPSVLQTPSSFGYGRIRGQGSRGDRGEETTKEYMSFRPEAARGSGGGERTSLHGNEVDNRYDRRGREDKWAAIPADTAVKVGQEKRGDTAVPISSRIGSSFGKDEWFTRPRRESVLDYGRTAGLGQRIAKDPRDTAGSGAGAGRSGVSWGLGPRAVTKEDLSRLDEEIANLSKTVEQASIAQTRQTLRNIKDSVDRQTEKVGDAWDSNRDFYTS